MSSPAGVAPHALTMQELENTVRNGKKKLYWSAFEVVLATTLPSGEPQETRYDAYHVNHNHLKKIHAGARGVHYVRVECKYCTAPRFTQSITVSTKKFEEHYMTLHALDALASADAKKAQQRKNAKMKNGGGDDDDGPEPIDIEDASEADGDESKQAKRGRTKAAAALPNAKRARRGALTKDDDDHVAAMQGAAAAVVALSGGAQRPTEGAATQAAAQQQPTSLPASLVDSSIVLDPADSDTKRAKKSYWTAYEVVICERVPRDTNDVEVTSAVGDDMVIRETRQDAWRVNHNALRRLHLDPENETTVRVECRFCEDPKFNQSITVSTRKFEQHYYYEHGDETQRQELEEKLAAKLADATVSGETSAGASSSLTKRRKSWKSLLMDRENKAIAATSTSASRLPYTGAPGGAKAALARHQRAMLLNWLVQDCLPLSTVMGDHFKAFAATLDRKFEAPQAQPLRVQLKQRFDTVCTEMKKVIHDESAAGTAFVATVEQFAVHTNSQSSQKNLSVSVHFINHEWERQQLLLASRTIPYEVNEATLQDTLRSVLEEFGVKVESVVACVVRQDGYVLTDVIEGLLGRSKSVERRPGVLLDCAASALHTLVQRGCAALPKDHPAVLSMDTILRQRGLDLPSHWIEAHAILTNETKNSSFASTHLLVQYLALLEPFVRVADEMSTASYPTIPMIFQYFRHLKDTLAQFQQTSEPSREVLKPTVAAMQAALDEVYGRVIPVDALAAYVLDPRFRFAHISSSDEEQIRQYLDASIAEILSTDASSSVDGESDAATVTTDASFVGSTRPTRSLFEELATSGKRSSAGSTVNLSTPGIASAAVSASCSTELVEYLALDDEDFSVDVLKWWQSRESQFPTLARVARRFLALVGTSIPAESLFTAVGQRIAIRRGLLDLDTLEATVVTRFNGGIASSLTSSLVHRVRANIQSPFVDPNGHKVATPPIPASAPVISMPVDGAEVGDVAIIV